MNSLSPRSPDDVRARAIEAEREIYGARAREEHIGPLGFAALGLAGALGALAFWLFVAIVFTF